MAEVEFLLVEFVLTLLAVFPAFVLVLVLVLAVLVFMVAVLVFMVAVLVFMVAVLVFMVAVLMVFIVVVAMFTMESLQRFMEISNLNFELFVDVSEFFPLLTRDLRL